MTGDAVPGKLRWQCRRGMRELDVLLQGWLDSCYATADEARRSAFERVLEAPDPQLTAWILGRERPQDAQVAILVDELTTLRRSG